MNTSSFFVCECVGLSFMFLTSCNLSCMGNFFIFFFLFFLGGGGSLLLLFAT